jgi:outer membrane protein OmpA-like peptidoglycan-associated protein
LRAWATVLAGVGAAHAADGAWQLETFEPRPLATGILDVSTTRVRPGGAWSVDVWSSFVRDALELTPTAPEDPRSGGSVRPDRLRLELLGAFAPIRGLELVAAVPFGLGFTEPTLGFAGRSPADLTAAGLGDVRVSVLVSLFELLGVDSPLGLGLELTGRAPTGATGPLEGESGMRGEPRFVLDVAVLGARVALNAGWHFRAQETLGSLVIDDTVDLGAGLELPLFTPALRLQGAVRAVLATEAHRAPTDPDARLSPRDADIAEGLVALRFSPSPRLSLLAGGGVGLTQAPGAPAWRLLGALGFTTDPARGDALAGPSDLADADGDGRSDRIDVCPFEPENVDGVRDADGCPESTRAAAPGEAETTETPPHDEATRDPRLPPLAERRDTDGDGLYDDEDGCVTEAEDRDGQADQDGCPDVDLDADGVADAADRCPTEAEIINGFDDLDGCPDVPTAADLDADGDGVATAQDVCPYELETRNGTRDEDGCPEGPPGLPDEQAASVVSSAAARALVPLAMTDADGDGVADPDDDCDGEPEDADGFNDADGCPEGDDDLDGFADTADRCPREAESADGFQDTDGCPDLGPDADADGVADLRDACPREAETRNGVRDDDGCPEGAGGRGVQRVEVAVAAVDRAAEDSPRDAAPVAERAAEPSVHGLPLLPLGDLDGDGLMADDDRCPQSAEDLDGFEDADGCPELDDDADGLADTADKCPREAESKNDFLDADGCPEVLAAADLGLVGAVRGIEFDPWSAILKPGSARVLGRVAERLKAQPAWRVQIVGHTDDQGDRVANQALSQRRAEAVRTWLVKRGIAAERLRAVGFGDAQPLSPNSSATARAKNRRVELVYEAE